MKERKTNSGCRGLRSSKHEKYGEKLPIFVGFVGITTVLCRNNYSSFGIPPRNCSVSKVRSSLVQVVTPQASLPNSAVRACRLWNALSWNALSTQRFLQVPRDLSTLCAPVSSSLTAVLFRSCSFHCSPFMFTHFQQKSDQFDQIDGSNLR